MADDVSSDQVGGTSDLDNLSPFKVLQRRAQDGSAQSVSVAVPTVITPVVPPVPAVSPAPIPSAIPQVPPALSKDELLKQANEAPATPFVLPTQEVMNQAAPVAVQAPAPVSVAVQPMATVPPQVIPVVPPRPVSPTPLAVPQKDVAMVRPPNPIIARAPLPGVTAAKPGMVQVLSNQATPQPLQIRSQPRVHTGVIIGISVAVVLVAGLGMGYVLAGSGKKVPFFFTQRTGLSTSGMTVAANALAFVQAEDTYQVAGKASIGFSSSSSSSTTSVPTLPVTSGQAGDVHKINTSLASGNFRNKDAEFIGKEQVTINDTPALSLAVHMGIAANDSSNVATSNNQWVYLAPVSTTPQVGQISDATMQQTLLYPVIRPIPLSVLLKSATKELYSLQETGSTGTKNMAYQYSVDSTPLASVLPKGAEITSMALVVRVTEKGNSLGVGTPYAATLSGKITYQSQSYDVNFDYTYSSWGTSLDTATDVDLGKIATPTSVPVRTISDVVHDLGILSVAALPNTLPADVISAAPTSTAIVPSGQTLAAAGLPVAAGSPPPLLPGADAKKDDDQRLKDLQDLQSALQSYKKVIGSFPVSNGTEQTGASATLFSALVPKFITAMPVDPLSSMYYYGYTSDGSTFTLRAIAEDGSRLEAKQGSNYYYFQITNK